MRNNAMSLEPICRKAICPGPLDKNLPVRNVIFWRKFQHPMMKSFDNVLMEMAELGLAQAWGHRVNYRTGK